MLENLSWLVVVVSVPRSFLQGHSIVLRIIVFFEEIKRAVFMLFSCYIFIDRKYIL